MFYFVISSYAGKGRMGKWQYRSHRINQEKYIIRHVDVELSIINKSPRKSLVKSDLQKNLDPPPPKKRTFYENGISMIMELFLFSSVILRSTQYIVFSLTRDGQSGIRVWFIRNGFSHLKENLSAQLKF